MSYAVTHGSATHSKEQTMKAFLFATTVLLTASTTYAKAPQHPTATAAESQALNELHEANRAEIAAGKLAAKHAEAADVKQYGEMLVTDHTKADEQVMKLAKEKGVTLARAKTTENETLHGQTGKDFDREFISMMVKDHQHAIAQAKDAESKASSDDMRALLKDTLPVLQKHLDRAQQLQSKE
jgi:putative membrane protein